MYVSTGFHRNSFATRSPELPSIDAPAQVVRSVEPTSVMKHPGNHRWSQEERWARLKKNQRERAKNTPTETWIGYAISRFDSLVGLLLRLNDAIINACLLWSFVKHWAISFGKISERLPEILLETYWK